MLDGIDAERIMPNAFEKSGLYPINAEKVLERLPNTITTMEITTNLDAVLLKRLDDARYEREKSKQSKARPKGKKVPAGISYCPEDSGSDEDDDVETAPDAGDGPSNDSSNDSGDDGDLPDPLEDVDSALAAGENADDELTEDVGQPSTSAQIMNVLMRSAPGSKRGKSPMKKGASKNIKSSIKNGNMVVATYEGEWFLAQVIEANIKHGYSKLNYMKIQGMNSFIWGASDELVTLNQDILLQNVSPVLLNSRGAIGLSKEDLKIVKEKMTNMVFYSNFHFYRIFLTFLI